MEGALDDYKMGDGRMVGFPFAVEGFSFIYNKQVLDKAVGESLILHQSKPQ